MCVVNQIGCSLAHDVRNAGKPGKDASDNAGGPVRNAQRPGRHPPLLTRRSREACGRRVLALGSLAITCLTCIFTATTLAWACVPQPLISLKPRASGPVGSEVTVDGLAVNGQAEIRWNGYDGPLLGRAVGPQFSVQVKIPESPEGLYSVIIIERQPGGGLGSSGRAEFLVTSASSGPSATMDGAAGATRSMPAGKSSLALPVGLALLGGVGLLVLGAFGGAVIYRKQARSAALD